MLQFLSHDEDDTVWEIILRAKFLNVGAWFPYINLHSTVIKFTSIQNLIITW